MRMEFLGAAHEVTGSQTLLTVNDRPFLVDCGMEQGANRFENKPLPVRPEALLCVLVTHAHIDHSGNLPLLYKRGFRGPIYATEETCNLLQIMLRDSAHIQVSDAEWKTRKAQRAGGPPVEPVYDLEGRRGRARPSAPLPLWRAPARARRRGDTLYGRWPPARLRGHRTVAARGRCGAQGGLQRRRGQYEPAPSARPAARGKRRCAYHRVHLRRPTPRKGAP